MTHNHLEFARYLQYCVGLQQSITYRISQNCYCKLEKLHSNNLLPFSALTLLVGHQEEHPACINSMMRCCCGYLSEERCTLFAYGPADATASQNPKMSFLI